MTPWESPTPCSTPEAVELFDRAADTANRHGYMAAQAAAKAICDRCPMLVACREWTLRQRPASIGGVSGGLSLADRRRGGRTAAKPEPKPKPAPAPLHDDPVIARRRVELLDDLNTFEHVRADRRATLAQLVPCGTYAAAQRHHVHGEPLDRACREARRAYWRDRAQRRRNYKKRAA